MATHKTKTLEQLKAELTKTGPAPASEDGEPVKPQRAHKATYARDKRKGGYLIRVEGPNAARFAGREVPVTRMDNSESTEKLAGLIWVGVDQKTGKPVALYAFEQKPKQQTEDDLLF